MANVLAQRIELGHLNHQQAMAYVREIQYQTPQTLLGMTPRPPKSR